MGSIWHPRSSDYFVFVCICSIPWVLSLSPFRHVVRRGKQIYYIRVYFFPNVINSLIICALGKILQLFDQIDMNDDCNWLQYPWWNLSPIDRDYKDDEWCLRCGEMSLRFIIVFFYWDQFSILLKQVLILLLKIGIPFVIASCFLDIKCIFLDCRAVLEGILTQAEDPFSYSSSWYQNSIKHVNKTYNNWRLTCRISGLFSYQCVAWYAFQSKF